MDRPTLRIAIDQNVFDAGAALLSVLAFPDEGDDKRRAELHGALCHLVLNATFSQDNETYCALQHMKPAYAFRTPDDVARGLRTFDRRLRDRVIAGKMAIPFLERASLPAQAMQSLPPITLDMLAVAALQEFSGRSDPGRDASNVKSRVWRPSLPVVHIAAAIVRIRKLVAQKGLGEVHLGHFLQHEWLVESTVSLAEEFAELITVRNALPGKPKPLVRIVLAKS